jgi:hypothetical protein
MGIKIGALLLFLLINSLVFAQQSKSEIPPQLHHYDKIGYDEDKTVVVSEWKSVNNGTGVYGNPKGILNLTCTAPYPIQWRIDGFIVRGLHNFTVRNVTGLIHYLFSIHQEAF